MRNTVLLAAAVALLAASSGNAQEFARKGFYIGGGGSYAHDTFKNDVEEDLSDALPLAEVDLNMDGSIGANGRVGYRFHPHFSAEVQGEWVQRFEGDATQLVPRIKDAVHVEIQPWLVTANARACAFSGRFQPYGVVGVGVLSAKIDVDDNAGLGLAGSERLTDFTMRLGGGLDLWATPHIGFTVGVDYVLPFGEVKDLDFISFIWGMQFQF